MLDTPGRHLALVLRLIYRLCENCKFPFLRDILNWSLHYVLWAAGLLRQSAPEAQGFYLRSTLMKITLEVRALSVFIFYTLGPCSQMDVLMPTHNLLINTLYIIYNQAAAKISSFDERK